MTTGSTQTFGDDAENLVLRVRLRRLRGQRPTDLGDLVDEHGAGPVYLAWRAAEALDTDREVLTAMLRRAGFKARSRRSGEEVVADVCFGQQRLTASFGPDGNLAQLWVES